MLQECNKFREYQTHKLLIELLEKELAQRQKLRRELQKAIAKPTNCWRRVNDVSMS